MRNVKLFSVLFALVLLAGCIGNPVSVKPPKNDDGPGDELFNGDPGTLVLQLGAPTVGILATQSHNGDPESHTAHIIIEQWGGANGPIVYSVEREVPFDPREGLLLPEDVPSGRGYHVFVVERETGTTRLIGQADIKDIPVPAFTTTTVKVETVPPEYDLVVPDQMYSGGAVNQIYLHRVDDMYNRSVLIGFNPWVVNDLPGLWRANPNPGEGWVSTTYSAGRLPEVDVETELYYQVSICSKRVNADGEQICSYYPDVEAGEPLPNVTVYPHP